MSTQVVEANGRLFCRRLAGDGSVEEWLELPTTLKQPLMALVAEVAAGKREQSDFPVPGGDKLVVRRAGGGLRLERLPVGFPNEGRELDVTPDALPLFLSQVRGV